MPGRDKERLFPDCRREEKGGRLLKYLTAKWSRWNEEVLFCFIFDVGKLRSYTGLPFKSQRCHSQWEFTVTPRMTFSRLLWLGSDGGMFTRRAHEGEGWLMQPVTASFNGSELSNFKYLHIRTAEPSYGHWPFCNNDTFRLKVRLQCNANVKWRTCRKNFILCFTTCAFCLAAFLNLHDLMFLATWGWAVNKTYYRLLKLAKGASVIRHNCLTDNIHRVSFPQSTFHSTF